MNSSAGRGCAFLETSTAWNETPLRNRLVIPGPFETDIWDRPDRDPAVFKDEEKFPPEDCAEGIVAAITRDRFEHCVPDMQAIVEIKTSNIENFLSGVVSRASEK